MRKAAASVPSNIVEGNARRTTREYVHFLNIAYASAAELAYLVDLAAELGYLSGAALTELNDSCGRVCRQAQALLQEMERRLAKEQAQRKKSTRPGKSDSSTTADRPDSPNPKAETGAQRPKT